MSGRQVWSSLAMIPLMSFDLFKFEFLAPRLQRSRGGRFCIHCFAIYSEVVVVLVALREVLSRSNWRAPQRA